MGELQLQWQALQTCHCSNLWTHNITEDIDVEQHIPNNQLPWYV